MTENDPYKIRVLATAEDCPEDGVCFMLGEIPGRPGKVQAVAQRIDDAQVHAAYAHRIGLGETLVEFDKRHHGGV